MAGPQGTRARDKRRATAMDLATAHPASPEIVVLLTAALEATTALKEATVSKMTVTHLDPCWGSC